MEEGMTSILSQDDINSKAIQSKLGIRTLDEKTILVFDICSSTNIVEDLHRTGSINRYNEMIDKINGFLKKKKKKSIPFDIYKFVGDGFILTFSPEMEIDAIVLFSQELTQFCLDSINDIIEYLEVPKLPRKGITIGIDKGFVHSFKLNSKDEIVGRAINLACRLQSSQDTPEMVNTILMSVKAFSELKNDKIREECKQQERTLRNIIVDKPIKCYELEIEKLKKIDLGKSTSGVMEKVAMDTIVVPAREEGFKREFLGNSRFYAITISKSRLDKIRYIAAYQAAPVSAITHYAEIERLEEYQNSGKYILYFKGKAKKIGPLKIAPKANRMVYAPQRPRYTSLKRLLAAKSMEDVFPPKE